MSEPSKNASLIAHLIQLWVKIPENECGSVEFIKTDDDWQVVLGECGENEDGYFAREWYGSCEHRWLDDNTPPDAEADMAEAFWRALAVAVGKQKAAEARAKLEAAR